MALQDLRHDTRQSQTLSPRLQHAVRLLQMSSLDFAATVHQTLGRNPFLELEEGEPEGEETQASDDEGHEAEALDERREDSPALAEQDNDRDLWQADGAGSGARAEDGQTSALELMEVETTLAQHLEGQLGVMKLDPRPLALARVIVGSLDDDGYLRTGLDELLDVEALQPRATLQEMESALQLVQSLEPAGVAARSVAECLLLQLPAIGCPELRALSQRIIADHLQLLATRNVPALARELNRPLPEIGQACERIRRLDPRPGWRFGSSRVDYVVPDVVVRKVRGDWKVQLNPAIVPRVRLNEVYAELFLRHKSPQCAEMAGHLQEARWTVRNAALRFATILDVAEAIVRRQRHFLEFGAMAMKPLGLREIAEEVGVHESTVSRVTNNKFMATPSGVFELKHFFSRAMVSANGSACSGTAIRGLIKDLIEAEPARAPLSDAEITRRLSAQGLVVARRTVTKYRQMLNISAVEQRRRAA